MLSKKKSIGTQENEWYNKKNKKTEILNEC